MQYNVDKTPAGTGFRSGSVTIAGHNFSITQGVAGGSNAPIFTSQGVVSAASLRAGAVSPGELITIFGSNIGPATLEKAALTQAGGLDSIAGGTRVLFDGVPAPMLYAVSGQAGAVVPFGLQPNGATQLQVEYLGTPSSPIALAVAATAPAIFTANQSGKGQGSILNQDSSINSAVAPAARGSVVAIYATGGGAMASTVIDGSLAQAPFATTLQNITVRIGGVPAEVLYQGAAPGLVQGVLQINARVPAGAAPGDTVPIDFTIGGITSPAGSYTGLALMGSLFVAQRFHRIEARSAAGRPDAEEEPDTDGDADTRKPPPIKAPPWVESETPARRCARFPSRCRAPECRPSR